MSTILHTLKITVLDTLFPASCVGCGAEGAWICTACARQVTGGMQQRCPICRIPGSPATCGKCRSTSSLDGLIVAAPYEQKLIQSAIHLLKYKYVEELAQFLGLQLLRALQAVDKTKPAGILSSHQRTVLVPVPLHRKRFLERGFNQAGLLCAVIAEYSSLTQYPHLLKRARKTESQAQLNRQQRLQNVVGAFSVADPFSIKGKNAILVDDVATTLATLHECSGVLKQAGARAVWGLVIARGS
ncbi:MAG: ComF family protein [Patescibacteria group bacterium]